MLEQEGGEKTESEIWPEEKGKENSHLPIVSGHPKCFASFNKEINSCEIVILVPFNRILGAGELAT